MQRDQRSAECVSHMHYSSIHGNHQVGTVKLVGQVGEIASRDICYRCSSRTINSRDQFFIQSELLATSSESYSIAVLNERLR
jgi:hypothetical protein